MSVASVFQKGGLTDIVQGMSDTERKAYLATRKSKARVRRAERQRDKKFIDFLDNPSRLPDKTIANIIFNSPLIMGLEEGIEGVTARAKLQPPQSDDIFLPKGQGDALASLERRNTPASLLSGSEEPFMGYSDSPLSRRHHEGANPFIDPPAQSRPASLEPTPSKLTPTNLNIANILSQLKPEDMTKIHRGNLKKMHPNFDFGDISK